MLNLLVISPPGLPHLRMLDRITDAAITVSSDPVELRKAAPEAEVLLNCTGSGAPVEAIWPELHRLRWVHSLAAGVENQIFTEFRESEIPLTNAAGVYAESLGEFALAAILYFAKDLPRMIAAKQQRRWDPFDVEMITGRTLSIIGYGGIGRAVARRTIAMGMRVLAIRRRAAEPGRDGVELRSVSQRLETIAESDYILMAAPLTPETRGSFGGAEFGAMKRTAVFINLGRGPVVDEPAMLQALSSGRIRGAALDVYHQEPLPPEHPLWGLPNVLLSPHCADHVEGWLEGSMQFFLENLDRFRRGQPLENIVDKHAGY
jgi:phosphoglycerate dehydrogenase-like enzyme